MFFLLVAALIGGGFAILAAQNTVSIPVHIASYTWTQVPVYLVAIASLLIELFLAWLFSLVNWASSSLTLHDKEVRARKAESSAGQLEARIKELEKKNAELERNYGN